MATQVILLNGASSAGKTSLALAIQELLPEPWLTLGVDTLIGAMPLKLLGSPDGLTIHEDGRVTVGLEMNAVEVAVRRNPVQVEQLAVEFPAYVREPPAKLSRLGACVREGSLGVELPERRWADDEHVGRAAAWACLACSHDLDEPADGARNGLRGQ